VQVQTQRGRPSKAMPYFTTILKASSLPPSAYVSLDELFRKHNPHGLSLASLVALIARENALRWCVKWIPQHLETSTVALSIAETERRLLIGFALVLEMIVAAQIAQEEIYDIIVIKQVLIAVREIILLVPK